MSGIYWCYSDSANDGLRHDLLKPDTAALAEKLASASGETVEQAVRTAIEHRARELGVNVEAGPESARRPDLARMTAIACRAAARPLLDGRGTDDIMEYDAHGLPR